MGVHGVCYEVTLDPKIVDSMGVPNAPISEPPKVSMTQEGNSRQVEKWGEAIDLLMHLNPFNNIVDKSKGVYEKGDDGKTSKSVKEMSFARFWTFLKEFLVWRVFQDYPTLVIF